MKKFLLFIIVSFSFSVVFAQIPTGYYDNAQGLNGATLKTALHNIIKTHTALSYTPGVWNAFSTTDRKTNGKVWDIYSDVPGGIPAYEWTFVTQQCGTYAKEGDCYNREHSFPQSWFGEASPMVTDVFHIYPTDGYVNAKRGNYPFGEVNSPTWTSTNGSKLGANVTSGYSGVVFEPIDEYKGDLARSYFYMATCYEDKLTSFNSVILDGTKYPAYVQWHLDLLIKWHEADPVSQKELDRNNAIYVVQQNRNPYIDHPEYVGSVWGTKSTAPSILNVYTNPLVPTENDNVIVYATITDGGTIDFTELNWGTTSGSLTNTVSMTAVGSLYSATIPAQVAGTRVYYKIIAEDNDYERTTTSEYNYYLSSFDGTILLPFTENFENGDLGIFTEYSVIGTQKWYNYAYSGNLMAKMSGYEGGAIANEDWLLTPKIDFNSYSNETLSFVTAMNYADATTTFQLLYSTNYSGSGDPNQAVWTDISSSATWSSGTYVWAPSGSIDLSGMAGNSVTLAFKYTNSATAAETWELDDVVVSATPIQTGIENAEFGSVSIFPNPSSDWIQLNGMLAQNSSVLIFNYLGQLELEENLKNTSNQQIYIGGLKAGIYILQLKSPVSKIQNLRLIIE